MKNRELTLPVFSSLGVLCFVACGGDDTSGTQGTGGMVDSGRADVGVGGVSGVRGGSNAS